MKSSEIWRKIPSKTFNTSSLSYHWQKRWICCSLQKNSTTTFLSSTITNSNLNNYPCTKNLHNSNININININNNNNLNLNQTLVSLPSRHFSSRVPKKRQKKEKEYLEWLEKNLEKQRESRSGAFGEIIEVDQKNALPLSEAIKRVVNLSRLTYDETIEFEIQLNLDPKKGNEYIRGNLLLPNGTGKERKICVFIPESMHKDALNYGADIIGTDELLKDIGNGKINIGIDKPFDVIIATQEYLRKLVPYGRQLGPHGLMPNVKMGTLTNDPLNAIKNSKLGQLPIRMSDGGKGKGIIGGPIGKTSFGEEKIYENVLSFVKQLRDDLKPPGGVNKQQYFLKAFLSSTQGRGYQVLVDSQEPWKKVRD